MDLLKYLVDLGKKEYIRKNYSLDNIKKVLEYLKNPQSSLKNIIHITGTNGKGSVAIYTSKILENLGYSVGLYISPHIYCITERIQYNNKPIDYEIFKKYLNEIYTLSPKKLFLKLTYFEILTCIMFLYFRDKNPDFVVLEVGLGGRLDATNIVDRSIISCITSISLDHTEILGKTEFEILKDKAGIIKPNSFFICGDVKERLKIFLKKMCKKLKTKFIDVKNEIKGIKLDFENWLTYFNYKKFKFILPTCSLIQPYNVLLSIKILETIKKAKLIEKLSYSKIAKVYKNTILPFRMQKIKFKNMYVFVDGAHNPKAISNFVSTIEKSKFLKIVLCLTLMKEKDYKKIFKILSKIKERIDKFIIYKINSKRMQNIDILYKEAKKYFGESVLRFYNTKDLLNYLTYFCKNQKIFFVGSFYISEIFNL